MEAIPRGSSGAAGRVTPGVVRVLIADHHPLVLDGLASLIQVDPGLQVVARAVEGREALRLLRELRPQVAILDLHMPGVDGVEATRELTRDVPGCAVVILSTFGEEDVHRSFHAGARGYLLKSASGEEIRTAIHAVAAGGRYLPPGMAEQLAAPAPGSTLTDREAQVLREIAHGKSNRQIATTLGLRETTVKWHINAVLGKLGVTDRTQAVLLALRRGLVRLDE